MKTKLILTIISLYISGSWAQQQNKIDNLKWLLGTWETKTSKGSLYETWTRKNETEFQAKSYYLNKRDTIEFESVRLVEKEKKLHYMVSVKSSNRDSPVDFVSKAIRDPAFLVFENRQHDFPQMITYRKVGEDSLYAEISGNINGKLSKQAFPMKKIK
ncbi:DUF6265 family protein [Chryseobacterium gregarium]|uniref:DUF6265 family protein n=1 Tax=Chryseobacterium gregarium TaxID=456299 RepID=UPI00040F7B67|nr:DUF6265 family protein [Chryseobacterium gregarium]